MVRVDRRSGKRVLDGWPSDDPKSAIIWEAFKPDTEPERYTRQDEIAARRNEILQLIRVGRQNAAGAVVEDISDQPEEFVEEPVAPE
jgi:penicillin-binding protein 1A